MAYAAFANLPRGMHRQLLAYGVGRGGGVGGGLSKLKKLAGYRCLGTKKKKRKEKEKRKKGEPQPSMQSEQPAEHFAQEIQFYGFVVLKSGRQRQKQMKYPWGVE